MTETAVTVTMVGSGALSFKKLEELLEELAPFHAVAGLAADTLEITLTAESPSFGSAADRALELVRKGLENIGAQGFNPVGVDVKTLEWQRHENERPNFPEVVGVAELAEYLKVSRQRASELVSSPTFPKPATTLRATPVWIKENVRRFVDEEWYRRPGRRPKVVDRGQDA